MCFNLHHTTLAHCLIKLPFGLQVKSEVLPKSALLFIFFDTKSSAVVLLVNSPHITLLLCDTTL